MRAIHFEHKDRNTVAASARVLRRHIRGHQRRPIAAAEAATPSGLPLDMAEPAARPGMEAAARGARAAGTPWLSFFRPEEMLTVAREAGFAEVAHVSADDLTARSVAGRADGSRRPDSGQMLVKYRSNLPRYPFGVRTADALVLIYVRLWSWTPGAGSLAPRRSGFQVGRISS